MDSPLLVLVPGLIPLEQADKWDEACALLDKVWREDVDNVYLIVRSMLESWYVCLEHGAGVVPADIDMELAVAFFRTSVDYGWAHFASDFAFLWAIVHVTAISGSMFLQNGPTDWDAARLEYQAYGMKLYGDDPFASAVFTEFNDYEEKTATFKKLRREIWQLFPGDSYLEGYFREMYDIK